MRDDDRGFEVGQKHVVQGVPGLADGVYVTTSTVDSTPVPSPVIGVFRYIELESECTVGTSCVVPDDA